jgi:hypothetical protein
MLYLYVLSYVSTNFQFGTVIENIFWPKKIVDSPALLLMIFQLYLAGSYICRVAVSSTPRHWPDWGK